MLKKLYKKYKSLGEPVKASFWFLICGFLQKGISMLTTPIFTRIMTEIEYGRYSIYISWYNILIIIASLELAAGVYTRGLIKNEKNADAFSSSLLSLSTLSILIFLGIYLIFRDVLNELFGVSTYLMLLMILEMLTTVTYQFWSNRERVAYRYKKLVYLMLTFTVLRPIAGTMAVLVADKHCQVEARVAAVALVNFLLFGGLYISILKKGKCFINKEYWKYALSFNLPLIPHYLSQIVLNQSDRIMIDKLCGATAVSYYSVAYSISQVMLIFNSAVSSTMNPWIYRAIKDKTYEKIGKVSYTILLGIAGLNFLVVAFGPELLRIIAPSNYYAAVWVIPPVTVSIYFTFLYNLFATFEYYFNKTKWVMVASVIGAAANIVLNAIFIPLYGFVAAGYTTLVCYILYSVAHYIFMRKVCIKYMDGYKVYDIKKIILIGLALIVGSAVMQLLYDYFVIRYVVLLAFVVVMFCLRKHIFAAIAEMKKSKQMIKKGVK